MTAYRTSSFCGANGCVEVAFSPDGSLRIRSSRDTEGTTLIFSAAEWLAFIRGVKAGEFDLPYAIEGE
ncbi:MAG: DUF397 domain-containing protein [Pseudonocardiales bacterium]|jgi:hypothetical protein|nr:DUF397 domain-containing protein [Pseudonocardiales bacterium]